MTDGREGEPEEYDDWSRPRADADSASDDDDKEWGPPAEMRDPLLRDRFRDRLGLTPQQWYVLESVLLVAPYPLFVLAYLLLDVNETAFLVVTLAYSLAAMYVGFLS